MSQLFWGIDIGGTNVKLGLVSTNGKLLAHDTIATHTPQGPSQCVERILISCQEMAKQNSVSIQDIKAFGLGCPGPLSQSQGRLFKPANLVEFDSFPIRAAISKHLHCPGVLDNDVNMSCWGEFMFGAGQGVNHLVHFAMGTGIGGGIIYDSQLLLGSEGNAAELGHMVINAQGRPCECGQRGCFEAYASADSTVRRAQEKLDAGKKSTLTQSYEEKRAITCKDVFDHALQGDALADEIVDGTAEAIAIAAINMRHVTEPQRITLGGGMVHAGDFLLNRVNKYYEKMVWHLKPEPLDIRLGVLGNNAGVLGAAGLAIDTYQKQQLPPLGR